jgi:Ser/Thr protein kinase RdoA (MazF antagonist)
MISTVLDFYGIDGQRSEIMPLTEGLINRTWKISTAKGEFILQQINSNVFKNPGHIAANIRMIDDHLKEHHSSYLFVAPLQSLEKQEMVIADNSYYRLFPFISGSHTISVVATPEQAYEASFQFGKFTRLLSDFDARKLHITIPGFHDLSLRYRQFEQSLKEGNPERIKQSGEMIAEIKNHLEIVTAFERIRANSSVKPRVMHHDTKISNILFDDKGKGICVIDLDTVMPGYFFSDVGDMMRTYLSPASEEEKDFSKIEVRDDFFRAIVRGYVDTMGDELTSEEKQLFFYSGQFLIFMQAIRFLSDHFNDDRYYGARYEGHNFIRAGNQVRLLKMLEAKRAVFEKIIADELKDHDRISSPLR